MTYRKNAPRDPTKGREPYGDTAPIVLDGVTTVQGGWENQPQGKGVQETMDLQVTGRDA